MAFPPVVWDIELSETLADTKVIAEAVGRRRALSGRPFPGLALGGVERPLPRRRAALRAGRPRPRRDDRDAHVGQHGHVPGQRPRPREQHQLHHRARRLHAERSRLLQREAQRGQRRGQPRRRQRQPELELRRRGRHRRSGDQLLRRRKQIKNFAAILFLSQGVPMFVAGDEIRRTQHGNNNAYCQDNDLSWFDWALAEKNADLFRFFKQMIALRRAAREPAPVGVPQRQAEPPRPAGHPLARPRARPARLGRRRHAGARLHARRRGDPLEPDLHVMMNMDDSPHDFAVPIGDGRRWLGSRTQRRRRPTTSPSLGQRARSRAIATPSQGAAS